MKLLSRLNKALYYARLNRQVGCGDGSIVANGCRITFEQLNSPKVLKPSLLHRIAKGQTPPQVYATLFTHVRAAKRSELRALIRRTRAGIRSGAL